MKRIYKYLLFGFAPILSSCSNLDLVPLSEGSSESWYSSETEIQLSVNELYREVFWPIDADDWSDDWCYRDVVTPITGGTINSEWGDSQTRWFNSYKAIARANTVILNMERAKQLGISQAKLDQFEAEARFVRAARYADLVSHFGDVVNVRKTMTIDEAFQVGRTDKNTVKQETYKDFDFAVEKLPATYGTSASKHATKGAALALKARFALYMGDWAIAAEAAKKCMDMNTYQLESDFAKFFLSSTKNSKESIFLIPRSIAMNVSFSDCQNFLPRNAGGWAAKAPSWDLLFSFLCSDGKPIDKSPLFNPRNPFANRDPRCNATLVPFGTAQCDFIYEPHPDTLKVIKVSTGALVTNNDNRANAAFASFSGLIWKKGIDQSWTQNGYKVDPDKVIIRYADVLLIYAEAMIELNQIDASVLTAINTVRARAYNVAPAAVDSYPAITTTDQAELRRALRIERRMEFALEGLRYMDIIRWRLAEKVLNKKQYAMLDVAELREKVVKPGLWFFPETPQVDNDGIANLDPIYDKGLIRVIAIRIFDKNRQYLWPIPSKEILINTNITQNPGY